MQRQRASGDVHVDAGKACRVSYRVSHFQKLVTLVIHFASRFPTSTARLPTRGHRATVTCTSLYVRTANKVVESMLLQKEITSTSRLCPLYPCSHRSEVRYLYLKEIRMVSYLGILVLYLIERAKPKEEVNPTSDGKCNPAFSVLLKT